MVTVASLTLPKASADILVRILRREALDRSGTANGATAAPVIFTADLARDVHRKLQTVHSALEPLVAEGLVTKQRGIVQLNRSAPQLPGIRDLVYLAYGTPLPPDVGDVMGLQLRAVPPALPYHPGLSPVAREQALTERAGPTMGAARRVVLDNLRFVRDIQPNLYAIRGRTGWREGDPLTLTDPIRAATRIVYDATAPAALESAGAPERMLAVEWAYHDALLSDAVTALLTYNVADTNRDLEPARNRLRALRNSHPDEPCFRTWMETYLAQHLP